jgi:hypothetical protein
MDEHAAAIGGNAFLVYCVLVRHADARQAWLQNKLTRWFPCYARPSTGQTIQRFGRG